MEIELSKGGRFNLSQEAPNLKKVAIGLGWQVNQAGQTYDIDASVFMLGADGKIPDEKYFVFYNNLRSLDGYLTHSGDNRTGEGNGDDETIYVDLAKKKGILGWLPQVSTSDFIFLERLDEIGERYHLVHTSSHCHHHRRGYHYLYHHRESHC
jgi:stress response protein SCP2